MTEKPDLLAPLRGKTFTADYGTVSFQGEGRDIGVCECVGDPTMGTYAQVASAVAHALNQALDPQERYPHMCRCNHDEIHYNHLDDDDERCPLCRALDERDEIGAQEDEIRTNLWAGHGHHGLYGDDGEMQCHECGRDFLREPLPELARHVANEYARLRERVEALEAAGNALRTAYGQDALAQAEEEWDILMDDKAAQSGSEEE